MLRLPSKFPLPGEILQFLSAEDCIKSIQVPGEKEGGDPVFLCPSLACPDGTSLALSLPEERNGLGQGLVRSLWFDRPVTLWLHRDGHTLRISAWAYRCHIVGPLFSRMLAAARRDCPTGDIACAWQLVPDSWEITSQAPPSPLPFPDGAPDLHFDNPLLRQSPR